MIRLLAALLLSACSTGPVVEYSGHEFMVMQCARGHATQWRMANPKAAYTMREAMPEHYLEGCATEVR